MANPVENCTVIQINPQGIVCQYTTSFGFVTRNTVHCVSILVWDTHKLFTWYTTQYSTGLHWNVLYMASIMWPLPLMGMNLSASYPGANAQVTKAWTPSKMDVLQTLEGKISKHPHYVVKNMWLSDKLLSHGSLRS